MTQRQGGLRKEAPFVLSHANRSEKSLLTCRRRALPGAQLQASGRRAELIGYPTRPSKSLYLQHLSGQSAMA